MPARKQEFLLSLLNTVSVRWINRITGSPGLLTLRRYADEYEKIKIHRPYFRSDPENSGRAGSAYHDFFHAGNTYSIMDMAWIGLLGAKAVAGVGVGGMYVWLSQGLASLSRMGGQVNTAQACGRKDYDQARSYAAGSLQLTALSGILFAAVCVIFIQPLLGFFQSDRRRNLYCCQILYIDSPVG